MATITPTITKVEAHNDRGHLVQWTLAGGTSDVGVPVQMFGSSDRSVQVVGTFSSTTVVIQGSNDGTNYATLNDAQGNALSFTATGGPKQIVELPRYIRASASGGTGTGIVVSLFMKLVR